MKRRTGMLVSVAVAFALLFLVSAADTRDVPHYNLHQFFNPANDTITVSPNDKNDGYMFLTQSARRYIPEARLLVSTDGGWRWDEQFNVRDIEIGQSFFLMLQVSVRVPGRWAQWFGADQILTNIAFAEDQILDINLINASVQWSLFSLERAIEEEDVYIMGIDNDIIASAAIGGVVGNVVVATLPALVGTAAFIESRTREARHNRALNDFLWGNHIDRFKSFAIPIPTSPVSDNDLARGVQVQDVTLIFEVTPLQSGSQTIKVFFDNRVNPIHMRTHTLIVAP